MKRTILHIDFDSFFASVEQQCTSSLRNKPIGVTAHTSRSAVIAASREAKKYGVQGGSSAKEAVQLCPSIQFVSAHFPQYFEVSKKFLAICRLYSPEIEVFSIDELFMEVTHTSHFFGGLDQLIFSLKKQILKELGAYITVSIGIAYNKLLAKLASGIDKPNGVTRITPENLDSVYARVKLTDICGIGQRIAARLNALGVYQLLQLRTMPFSALKSEFGPHEAIFLQNVAWAKDDTPLVHFGNSTDTKSVGRNYNLPKNEYNKRIVVQTILELYEELGIKLRRLGKKGRTVGLLLHGNTTIHMRKTVTFFTDKGQDMLEIMTANGLGNMLQELVYVRQVHVWISNLSDSNTITLSLFDSVSKIDQITKAIDDLNEKYGDHTIRNGFLLYSDKLTTVPNGFLADRWERKELSKLY